MPVRLSTVPSPQATFKLLTVPSRSAAEMVKVMAVLVGTVVADSVKLTVGPTSVTVTATVTVWDSDPLVPCTVTVYVPGFVELTVNVDIAVPPLVRVTLAVLKDAARPDGETVVERVTVPAKL